MRTDAPLRLAVTVAGIDEEYQHSVLKGIIACAEAEQINIACFASFSGVLGNVLFDIGENNIYNLIHYADFDGIILLTNTISDVETQHRIIQAVLDTGIPAAVLDNDAHPEFYNIRIDNAIAMRKIVEHVIEVHHARRLCFLSGTPGNPEAELRKQAFLDVMQEHQLPVDESLMLNGSFRPMDGAKAANALLASGQPLPDAMICANDAMALEAMHTFDQNGVRIPKDIIVTGFDNTYYAQYHSPMLTTVRRPLYDAGYTACSTILRVLRGEQCEKTIALASEPAFRESCGCTESESEDITNYKKKTYRLLNSSRAGVSLLNRITSTLSEADTEEELVQALSQFISELECDDFCLCFCDNWQETAHSQSSGNAVSYCVHGYTEEMSAPLIWRNGERSSIRLFRSEKMFPVPLTSGGNISYFFPLHYRERCLGYCIITNSDFPLQSAHCYSIITSISNAMENVRKLLHLNDAVDELERLYVIDPLCHIYNRSGFIRLANEMFAKSTRDGTNVMIAFIDMDGLKPINDCYGHDEGDFALQKLAEILSDIRIGNAVCARFGGDEFIMFATDIAEESGPAIEEAFCKRIAEVNQVIHKPYTLSASIGTIITKAAPDTKLFSLIAEADKIMYEQKKRKKTSRYLRKD